MHPEETGWFPDPYGRFEYRWFDGTAWTARVGRRGQERVDPEGADRGRVPRALADRGWVRRRVQRQVRRNGGVGQRPARQHGLLDADVLVVNQKAKLVELANEYMVYDAHGVQVGAVREVNQSLARRALRAVTGVDRYLRHQLEITDATGAAVLRLERPATLLRSTLVVRGPAGDCIGRIVQLNVLGRARFTLCADGGRRVGMLTADGVRGSDYHVLDEEGAAIAHIHKTFEGLPRALLTTADNYVVRIPHPLPDPLRSLTTAAAVCVDTALEQGRL